MSFSSLHITLAQINPIVGNIDYNLHKIRKIRDDSPATTNLIIFPELALCGYPPEDLVLKPFFLEKIESAVNALANESKTKYIALSCPWRHDGKIMSALHIIGDGKIQSTIYKHNLPNYGVFDEARIFKSGPLADPVTVHGHKLGFLVCEDTWTADVSKNLKNGGAEILISVNASPYEITKHDQRLDIARARVKETGLPLIYVNQCGGQDEIVFDGASFVLNEHGDVILQAEEFVEDTHHTVWNRTGNGSGVGHWLCGTDTIYEIHEKTEALYQAVMIALRDYVTKNGFSGVLIGMSGGVDSALSAAIAVDALGADAVHGVMMPSVYTSAESHKDAKETCHALGIHYDVISIADQVSAFEKELAPHFTDDTPDITHQNIQSRCRGVTLMALSNATGKMVLSTGNKSEIAVGYATLYGDMCGGFNALKDIYKTQVYELSRWRNLHRPDHGFGPQGQVIPENVLTKAPTAELKPGQKDQDSLPPYDVLDDILTGLIEHDWDVKTIARNGNHHPQLVQKIWRMLDIAEYKRRQAAPGPKITHRAFGRERRYPITNHFSRIIED
ncbi:MAG: NAD+ synthase [Micavibrio sp.]